MLNRVCGLSNVVKYWRHSQTVPEAQSVISCVREHDLTLHHTGRAHSKVEEADCGLFCCTVKSLKDCFFKMQSRQIRWGERATILFIKSLQLVRRVHFTLTLCSIARYLFPDPHSMLWS